MEQSGLFDYNGHIMSSNNIFERQFEFSGRKLPTFLASHLDSALPTVAKSPSQSTSQRHRDIKALLLQLIPFISKIGPEHPLPLGKITPYPQSTFPHPSPFRQVHCSYFLNGRLSFRLTLAASARPGALHSASASMTRRPSCRSRISFFNILSSIDL